MALRWYAALEQGPPVNFIQWLWNKNLLVNQLRCAQCNLAKILTFNLKNHHPIRTLLIWYIFCTLFH